MSDELDLEKWPDCLVPGCPNKCCLALDSVFCHPHTGEFFVVPEVEIVNWDELNALYDLMTGVIWPPK